MNLSNFTQKLGNSLTRNSPAIFMGLTIAGVISTALVAARAQRRATERLAVVDPDKSMTFGEKAKATWKIYTPVVLSCGATIGFVFAGNSIHFKRQAALATAVSIGETAFSEYKEKAAEVLGKTKAEKVRNELTQSKVDEKRDAIEQLEIVTPGDQHVYDTYSGRVFVSSVEKLNKAANEVARECINADYASLNSFYRKVGLAEIPLGDEVGWNNSNPLELNLSNAVVHDNRGLIAINYDKRPIVGFDRFW